MTTAEPMHEGELVVTESLVRALVDEQLPAWSGRPLRRVPSRGTVNAIWRLGDDLVLRLPRTERWALGGDELETMHDWLRAVRADLPLTIPEPVAVGRPGADYPWPWAVHRWIDGEPLTSPTNADVADAPETARRLGRFVNAMHGLPAPPVEAPRSVKAISRAAWNTRFPEVVAGLHGLVDVDALTEVWQRTLTVPGWQGPSVWSHADLLPDNLLARDGRIDAVIDFECYGAGEPALDLAPAWFVFSAPQRSIFRDTVQPDADTWERARNHALRAVMGIRYYEKSNPGFSAMALRTVREAMRGD